MVKINHEYFITFIKKYKMKIVSLLFCGILSLFTIQNFAQSKETKSTAKTLKAVSKTSNEMHKSIYDFQFEDINGNPYNFKELKGKKVMIVNTASNCGFTSQYADLEKLYQNFKDDNFIIIGFPANNFGEQEPGTNKEIAAFCQKNYGVSFPMMSKISVAGKDAHDLYNFLTTKERNGFQDSKVEWNFQKYLINEKGQLVKVVSPKTSPLDDSITKWIKG